MIAEHVTVRPLARSDRDQLVALVNAHLAAVVPGMSISVQALLASLEREPGEFIVDRWVSERATLVADQRGRIVAATQLLRYADGPDVGADYRGAGEFRWLLCYPEAPFWPGSEAAGRLLARAGLAQLARWHVTRVYGDGTLARPGVYGVPHVWPHVLQIYAELGLAGGTTETVWIATAADLHDHTRVVPDDVGMERTLGVSGTRFTAVRDGQRLGYLEIDVLDGETVRLATASRWADIGNLHVEAEHRRQGVGRALLRESVQWLDLAGVPRLLAYSTPGDDETAFYEATGFRELTRTRRGLSLTPP